METKEYIVKQSLVLDRMVSLADKVGDIINRANKVTDGSTQIPYQEFTFTIAAGQQQIVFQAFNYFRVLALSAGSLSVQFGQNGVVTQFTGAGVGLRFEEKFDRVVLINTSGVSMTITIGIAMGNINDDRLTVSGTVTVDGVVDLRSGTDINNAQVSVTTVATLLSAQSTSKRSVMIRNMSSSASTMYIGDSAVSTVNGMELLVGDSIVIDTQAAVYGRIPSGSATASVIEVNN